MDKHAATAADDAPYAGLPGQTRYDSVHLVQPDGSLRAIAVCRGVNVQTHPELGARALDGSLHRLDDGRELALPFVYHDPAARKLALVIPSVLAHTELKEWSKLMAEIADDTRHSVPRYVRESSTVLGLAALARFLEDTGSSDEAVVVDSAPPPAQTEHAGLLLQRERELAEQERSLIRMAEALTAREGDLLRQREQLETARVDLEIREQELATFRARSTSDDPPHPSGGWREQPGDAGTTEATVVASLSRDAAVSATFAADSDAPPSGVDVPPSSRSVPPPLHRRSAAPPPLPARPMRVGPPPLHRWRNTDEALTVVSRPSEPPPLPLRGAELVADAESLAEPEPAPELEPPQYFETQRAGQMALKLAQDELWLFVHLDHTRVQAFRRGAELMLQYAQVDGYPVVVLSLVDAAADEPYAIRLALDGRAETDLRVLEHLSRSFRARVALYVNAEYVQTVTVSTLREAVAEAILEKIGSLPRESSGAPTPNEAMVRVLRSPPPLWNDDLPFGPARREAPTTLAVLAAVEQLGSWLRPDKLAEATLTYSVPRSVIEASTRRVLRAAVVFGIALPDDLLALAVGHHIASDAQALVREQLQAFRSRVRQSENDLSAEVTARNWQALLARAESLGIALDADERVLTAAPGPAADGVEGAQRLGRPLEGLSAAEVRERLEEPAHCMEAIVELCERGHPSALEAIFGALPRLSASETASAVSRVLAFGEAAGDALIMALDSPSEPLRQCAALALGRLRLRRAVLPLLKRLEQESTPAWTEVARALGDLGVSAVRNVAWAVPAATERERLAVALAHLANHGASREVEKLENDPDPDVAQVARRAMSRRSRLEWEDLAVREQRTLADDNAAARLSQAFYAQAPKPDAAKPEN